MNKENVFLVSMLVVVTLPLLVYSTQTVLSQSQIFEVASDDLVAPIGGGVSYYTFSVPERQLILD